MHLFRNWAGTATAQPQAFFTPQSEPEIVAILQRAAQAGQLAVSLDFRLADGATVEGARPVVASIVRALSERARTVALP